MLLALAAGLLGLLQPTSLADLPPITAGTMRVFVVRHGQSVHNLQPPPDLPPDQLDRLTPLGHIQARVAGQALRAQGVGLIVCSPLRRARETADGIRTALGDVEVRVDERLRPLEMGTNGTARPSNGTTAGRSGSSAATPRPATASRWASSACGSSR